MGARLNTFVHVVELDDNGVQTGRAEMFGPGVDLPGWAINAIDNPDVWDGDPPKRVDRNRPISVTPNTSADTSLVEVLRKRIAELEAAAADNASAAAAADAGSGDEAAKPTPPPRSGPGSGRDAWAAYAERHGAVVPADATREQIITALDEAKVPTQ